MKNKTKFVRYGLLAAIVLAVLSLSGCVSNPDTGGNQQSGQGAQSSDFPFKVLTSSTPVTEAPTSTPEMNTPTLAPTIPGVQPPFGGVVTPPIATGSVAPSATIGIVTQAPTNTVAPTPTVLVLKKGSKGAEVRMLQKRLKELGYLTGSADGDFGAATEQALKAFQSRNGIQSDGKAGPATLAKINSTKAVRAKITQAPTKRIIATPTPKISNNTYLKLGDSGAQVRKMQERLISLGYLSGKASGRFDTVTEDAVYAFQRRNVPYADGIAGPLTLQALYSSNARRTSTSQGVIGTTLQRGLEDSAAVRKLQSRLKELGYYFGSTDGDFGPSTEQAVKSFQQNNGLKVDGKAGESTLNVLYSNLARSAKQGGNNGGSNITPIPKGTPITNYRNVTPHPNGIYVTLREGDGGILVKNLQQALKDQGYLHGTVDGKYGTSTVEAVKRFQEVKGLSQDGVAGPATQRTLFEGNYPIGS